MKAFYILKPDAIQRKEVIDSYKETISEIKGIYNRSQFIIDSWNYLSCMLYDPKDKQLTKDDLIKLRRQLLTTIKCYDHLYQDKPAIIDIFDIDEELLKYLEEIKYQIRKKYVLNTPKNYLKFNNLSSSNLEKELSNILTRELDISHIKVNYNESIDIPGYNLAFLNCIHFPDPDTFSIERDLEIIEKSKTLTKKIKL